MDLSRPPLPSATDTDAFIRWMLRYGSFMEDIRLVFTRDNPIEKVVDVLLRMVNKEITDRNLHSGEALLDRAGELATHYQTTVQKLVDEKGGIANCGPQLCDMATQIRVKMHIFSRLAKYKYGLPVGPRWSEL